MHEFRNRTEDDVEWFVGLWKDLDKDPECEVADYEDRYTAPNTQGHRGGAPSSRGSLPRLADIETWGEVVDALYVRDEYCQRQQFAQVSRYCRHCGMVQSRRRGAPAEHALGCRKTDLKRLLEGRHIDDLDGGKDDNSGIQSLTRGPEPDIRTFATRQEQAAAIVKYLHGLRSEEEALRNACVVTRTSRERNSITEEIRASGLEVVPIAAGGDARAAEGVRVATMHRVKGLEFGRVILASANAGVLPLKAAIKAEGELDPAERAAVETQERCVAYVAASRAKKELLVYSYGEPSPFLTK